MISNDFDFDIANFSFLDNSACLPLTFIRLCVCASFPFSFQGVMWDLIVLIPDHCLVFTMY